MPPSVEALGNSAQPPDLERFGQFGSNTKVNAGYYQLTITGDSTQWERFLLSKFLTMLGPQYPNPITPTRIMVHLF
jgi:hypothetical protein